MERVMERDLERLAHRAGREGPRCVAQLYYYTGVLMDHV